MKIVYLITRSDEIGGAHIHVRDLADSFSSLGHDVTVLVGGSGVYVDLLSSRNVKCISIASLTRSINPIKDLISLFHLSYGLWRLNPDILSLHSAKAGVLGRLIFFKRSKCKVIFTAHGWSFSDGVSTASRHVYRIIESCLGSLADRIVCVCQKDLDLAFKSKISSSKRLVCIHNGMPDKFKLYPPNRDLNRIPEILCIARFENQKDHLSLFHALSNLTHRRWRLSLVGDGNLKEEYISLVSKLSIAENVSFLGRREDVYPLLARSNIFVLPSLWEGFPRSILEAMMMSLPIIASDVGGVSESVRHGINGFLIQRSDISAWTVALEQLLDNPTKCEMLGAAGRRIYLAEYTYQRMMNRYLDLYLSLIGK